MASVKVLIVEDEAIVAKHIENSLKSLGYGVVGIARSGKQALQKVAQTSPDLVLMDIHLKGEMDGVEAAERIRSQFDIPVVYLTAYADDRTVERAKLTEPFGYIFKPFNSRDLRVTIEIALYRHQMEQKVRENEALARALLNAPTDWVMLVDADRKILDVNQTVADGMGQPPEALIGRGLSELFPPELLQSQAAHMERVLRSGEPVRFEVENQGVWLDTILHPILDAEGQVAKVAVFSRDITERVQAKQRVERSRQFLQSVLDALPDNVAILDSSGAILSVNASWRRFAQDNDLAWLDDGVGRNYLEVCDTASGEEADQARRAAQGIRQVIAGQQDDFYMEYVCHSQDEQRWFAMQVTCFDYNGVAWAVVTHENITKRIRIESKEKAMLEALRINNSAIESSINAVALSDLEGNLTYVNDAFLKLWGYDQRQQVLGRPAVEFWDAREEAAAVVDALFNQGGWVGELVAKRKDGSLCPVQISASLVTDEAGNPIRLMASFLDVSERRLTRRFMETRLSLIEYAASHTLGELLTRSLDEVGAFVDSPIGFYHFVEPDQKTLSLQQWSTRTLQEFCQAEGRGMHYGIDQAGVWVDCVHEKAPVIHNDYAALPHKKGMPAGHAEVTRELVVPVMRNDQVVAILGVGNKPSDYTHKDAEIVSYLADVTWEIVKQKRADEALQRYALELEQRSQETKQFVYVVSHDLRTPLFNLKGFANILSDAMEVIAPVVEAALPGLDESQRQAVTCAWQEDVPEALEFIQSSVAKMDRFIKAILKLSRLGRHQLELELVDMEALVQGTLDTLAHKIQDREVQVTVGPLPEVVADWLSMEQIMGNLLSNAVFYLDPNRPGRIEIRGERGLDETIFYVRDNGVGIAQEDAAEVFVPFRRVGGQAVPGEGMGLAYVRTLVQRHQGRIWFESELGAGTTFVFSISNHLNQNNLDG